MVRTTSCRESSLSKFYVCSLVARNRRHQYLVSAPLIFPIIVRTHRVPFYAPRACAKSARTDLSPLPRRGMAAIVASIMSAAKIMSMFREDPIQSLDEALP